MLDLSFYKDKRVFITGHTGFKGAWLTRMLVNAGADVTGYALDPPTEPSLYEMAGLEGKINEFRADIRDADILWHAIKLVRPEIIIHMAAQPIVRESYIDPRYTYETNVMGTVNLLDCVRVLAENGAAPRSVLNVTTDKVYLNREIDGYGYREDDPLDGYDPYSNSKSCSELVTHSYKNSFLRNHGVAVSTARAGNVIGGGDFAKDRIIPDCVRAVQNGEAIRVRNPFSTRPYQHVLEPLAVYLEIAQRQYEDPSYQGYYNVGPDDCDCVTTGELVDLFCRHYGDGARWMSMAEVNAPHEASYLKLDNSKIKETFDWQPHWRIDECMQQTVQFAKTWVHGGDIPTEMDREIEAFVSSHAS